MAKQHLNIYCSVSKLLLVWFHFLKYLPQFFIQDWADLEIFTVTWGEIHGKQTVTGPSRITKLTPRVIDSIFPGHGLFELKR